MILVLTSFGIFPPFSVFHLFSLFFIFKWGQNSYLVLECTAILIMFVRATVDVSCIKIAIWSNTGTRQSLLINIISRKILQQIYYLLYSPRIVVWYRLSTQCHCGFQPLLLHYTGSDFISLRRLYYWAWSKSCSLCISADINGPSHITDWAQGM